MDARRRTLASEGPLGNALPPPTSGLTSSSQSSLPLPSGLSKPPVRTRMSIAPSAAPNAKRMSIAPGGQGRASVMGGGGGGGGGGSQELKRSASQEGLGGGVMRRSTMLGPRAGAGGEAPGLMSASRGDAGVYGRTPQTMRSVPSSARRSSVYTSASGRPSIAPSALPASSSSASSWKEYRPLRDRTFQAQCQRNIADYLIQHRCPVPIGPKTLVAPTQKEFVTIFRWLINDLIDPDYQWGKKFEDDAMGLLRDLRYPAASDIGKTGLTAPGTPMYWPIMLGMLNWLVELCKATDNWLDPSIISDPLLQPAAELPLDHPLVEDRMFWEFTSKSYLKWFDGSEECAEEEQELEEMYERLAAASFDECERLETDVQKRQVELAQLQAQEPPLKKLEDEYVQLMSDKTKFIAFIKMYEQKAEKLRLGNVKAQTLIEENETKIASLRAELAHTEQAVAQQNLSPDEVQRMNHERETLTRQLDELRSKIAEASQAAYDSEMQVTKSMDRFEQLLQDYTALGHQIGVIPSPLSADSASLLGPGGIDYSVDLELGVEDLGEVQEKGRRMRQVIWPGLQSYGEGFRKQVLELGNKTIGLEDEYDRLGQGVERQKEEVGNLEMRLKVVHEQAEEAKGQLQAETAETNRTVQKLENEVTAMSTASQQGVLTVQSQLESTKIAFKELRHKTALLQDSVVAQLMSHIDVIIKAKEHTANSLKAVRSFAEAT